MSKKYKKINIGKQAQQQPAKKSTEEVIMSLLPMIIPEQQLEVSEEQQSSNNKDVISERQLLLHKMKCKLHNKELDYKPIPKTEEVLILKQYSLVKFGRMQPMEILINSLNNINK